MRSAPALACAILLVACGEDAPPEAVRIDCASAGAPLARDCTVGRTAAADGAILILRKPDGGFRRLLVTGRGIEAADGAEPAETSQIEDGRTEVAIGDDLFLLPPELP